MQRVGGLGRVHVPPTIRATSPEAAALASIQTVAPHGSTYGRAGSKTELILSSQTDTLAATLQMLSMLQYQLRKLETPFCKGNLRLFDILSIQQRWWEARVQGRGLRRTLARSAEAVPGSPKTKSAQPTQYSA